MTKKMKWFWLLLLAGITVWNAKLNRQENVTLSDLTMANIDALAQGEGDGFIYRCYGFGDIDCPGSNEKVAYVFGPFSLD